MLEWTMIHLLGFKSMISKTENYDGFGKKKSLTKAIVSKIIVIFNNLERSH